MVICGSPIGGGHAAVDAEGGGAQRVVRGEDDVDAVEADARFVDQGRADDPGIVEREQLPLAITLIAAAGKAVAVG